MITITRERYNEVKRRKLFFRYEDDSPGNKEPIWRDPGCWIDLSGQKYLGFIPRRHGLLVLDFDLPDADANLRLSAELRERLEALGFSTAAEGLSSSGIGRHLYINCNDETFHTLGINLLPLMPLYMDGNKVGDIIYGGGSCHVKTLKHRWIFDDFGYVRIPALDRTIDISWLRPPDGAMPVSYIEAVQSGIPTGYPG